MARPTKKKGDGGGVGQPTLLTDALWEEVLQDIRDGKPIKAIAKRDDMPSERTLWRWIFSDPQMTAQYDRAKAEQLLVIMDEIVKHADDLPEVPDPSQVAARKLSVDTRKWVASKLLPFKYGERITQDVNVTVDHESVLNKAIERMIRGKPDAD